MKSILLLTLLAFCPSAIAQIPKLFAIITEVIDQDTSTAVYSISVDPHTGAIKNVSENFFFAGGSATVDGISALNQKTGVYIYASDAEDTFAYEVNVYAGRLLAPLDIDAKVILHFTADANNNRFLTVAQDASTLDINVLAIDGTNGRTTILTQTPPAANMDYISCGCIEPTKGNYLLVAATAANNTRPGYKIFTFSPDGQLLSTSPAIGADGFPLRVAYDAVSMKLVGLLEQWTNDKLHYSVMEVDPKTAATVTTPVQSIVDGIVTSVTYSKADRALYFSEARNAVGGILHNWNVAARNETTVAIQGGWVLESVEASS